MARRSLSLLSERLLLIGRAPVLGARGDLVVLDTRVGLELACVGPRTLAADVFILPC